jgi:pantothenate kinase
MQTLPLPNLLPEGAAGIDAGMTMTKIVRHTPEGIDVSAEEIGAQRRSRASGTVAAIDSNAWASIRYQSHTIGVIGARLGDLAAQEGRSEAEIRRQPDIVAVPEIDAAARGCIALLAADDALGDGDFLMALLGTGTAFAAVRAGKATSPRRVFDHLGGTALGGGSFAALARRLAPAYSYTDAIAAAERGDRRNVDAMISDVYPDGIGRVSADLTAAHLAAAGGDPASAGYAKNGEASLDDFLAGLLNLHGESIAQIAAGRARMATLNRIVLCGGFIHNNPRLEESITQMATLFGHTVEVTQAPAYAGAIGAALTAAEA